MFQQSKYFSKLIQVFERLLNETLKPLKKENLSQMMRNFPNETVENFSNLCLYSIEKNTTDEFHEIIKEKNVDEKLAKLELITRMANENFSLNMDAFKFHEIDPERLKKKIIMDAKKQEIDKLKRLLTNLERSNEALENKKNKIYNELEESRKQIQTTISKLQQVTNPNI